MIIAILSVYDKIGFSYQYKFADELYLSSEM